MEQLVGTQERDIVYFVHSPAARAALMALVAIADADRAQLAQSKAQLGALSGVSVTSGPGMHLSLPLLAALQLSGCWPGAWRTVQIKGRLSVVIHPFPLLVAWQLSGCWSGAWRADQKKVWLICHHNHAPLRLESLRAQWQHGLCAD